MHSCSFTGCEKRQIALRNKSPTQVIRNTHLNCFISKREWLRIRNISNKLSAKAVECIVTLSKW